MIKRLRPYLGVGLAAWVASASLVMAQGDFYIELRGPESSDSARGQQTREATPAPRPVQQASPAVQTRPIQQIGTGVGTAARPSRYGPVRSTDTLWTIAEKHTRAPVTVQQTMVALYHLNPRAFVRGNINNIQRGVQLRLPTDTQARQRSAGEAQAEFGRLTRQGNRRVVQGASAPRQPQLAAAPVSAPKPAVQPAAKPVTPTPQPVVSGAPTAALPPSTQPNLDATGLTAPKAATDGLTELKAAPAIVEGAPATPAAAEETALSRLQLQLMDELREQVSMSNEQLSSLADNNQALRQHLAQLSAEVAELKANTDERGSHQEVMPDAELESKPEGWLQDLLNNPINLALLLMLPALLLLALFTLWWRKRERSAIAAQEEALSESTMMMEDERDEFDDLFTTSGDDNLELDAFAPEEAVVEQDIDEDAFARFLEEQQRLEEAEAERQVEEAMPEPTPEPEVEPEIGPEIAPEPVEEPFIEDTLFEDELFEDETGIATTDSLSNDELDDLFNTGLGEDDPVLSADEAALSVEDTSFADALVAESQVYETAPSLDELADTPPTADEPALREQDAPPARLVDDWPAESMAEMEPDAAPEPEAEPEPYVSVDELMADAERGEGPDPERERTLDLELDDYANVIGQGQGIDIDIDEGGLSGQLDLARAYIEIDDIDSARDLLNEALERGNAEQQRDAKKLLQRLDKRG